MYNYYTLCFIGPIPTDLGVSDVTHDSVIVHWSVPTIGLSPSDSYIYTVKYGTTDDDLSSKSRPGTLAESHDYQYHVKLEDLTHDTTYFYCVTATDPNHGCIYTSAIATFNTNKGLHMHELRTK